jgi:two-component system sensor histidine kinase YesM
LNEEMNEANQKLYMTELSKKQADLAAIQSQINPHFLYNTLDCIRGIAISEGVEVVANISTAMSKIFRYSIKAANFVKVEDELECIKKYLSIIQIRHGNRFTIKYDIDENVNKMIIPKMTFQPLVENAVFHGLERRSGEGLLAISAKMDGNVMVFEIFDNGVGMNEETLEKLKESLKEDVLTQHKLTENKSIGIRNINQRLKLIYADGYNIAIESKVSEGTRIIISIKEEVDINENNSTVPKM